MYFDILFRRLLRSRCAFYELSRHHQDSLAPPTALSAKTVAIMAHNKGLELGADMVLLLWGRQGRGVEGARVGWWWSGRGGVWGGCCLCRK